MANVRSHTDDVSMSLDELVEAPPGHGDSCGDHTEHESTSQPSTNVSRDMRLIPAGIKPQACPVLPPSKSLADVISLEESSQVPTSNSQVASSQQPSPESLMSLGIKVRDFAYENTLPAIVPVPRVPRQVQPAPKRTQRDWHDDGLSSQAKPLSEETGSKRPRYLERKATEPLQEPAVQHSRTVERITVNGLCAIIAPPRRALPARPRTRLSASPPTSPLMPPLASQASELALRPSAIPAFVVNGEDTASRPLSLRPVLYTRLTLDPRTSPAPSPPRDELPPPPISPKDDLLSSVKEPGADLLVRECRSRGIADSTTPTKRYQLRPRPSASNLSRCSRQTRRVR